MNGRVSDAHSPMRHELKLRQNDVIGTGMGSYHYEISYDENLHYHSRP